MFLRELTLSPHEYSLPLPADNLFVLVIDSFFVEQVDEPAIYLSFYGYDVNYYPLIEEYYSPNSF
jgi:hypothetical protein